MSPRTPRRIRFRQAGFGLIEVLIAIVILAIGMLGVAAMQSVSLRNSLSASQRSIAVTQTYALIDAMRANRSEALIGRYDLSSWTCAAPEGGTLATDDLRQWMTTLQAALGSSACAKVACGSDSCAVRVRWDDSRGSGDATDLAATEILTETRL